MNSLIKLNSNAKSGLFPEFPSLFDDFITKDFFNLPSLSALRSVTTPAVNVKETNSAFELEMAIPGLNKKDFKIAIENNKLYISAESENKKEEDSEDGRYSRREFSYQSFTREFHLPENSVNENNISANYTDGILHVVVPKKEVSKPKLLREIAVE
ncbi:Hsp20/alpha crystallin family protein [Aurantibacillus circumpalustris]|uniref:Hsp20/alpha crystallin family protein n=1 Tax=Aurantibacillus circumpalustris TaxID=3036359 RepID=UPI00295ACA87|nr:Hsp20/alpha crystallin family protein [Aurantibacillus circumpalustris]